jgi:branched-chain amino acid transport system ATP-binding protein
MEFHYQYCLAACPSGVTRSEIARRGLGRTFQTSNKLFRGMTVLENMMTGVHRRTESNIFGSGFRSRGATEVENEAEHAARQSLEFVGMSQFADQRGTELLLDSNAS